MVLPLFAQVARASRWSAFSEAVSKAITPIVFVVLARFLTPEDFGVVAVAAIVISFSNVFWESGLSLALVRARTDLEAAADVIFWTNVAIGAVVYALLFIAANWLALIFGDPRIAGVLRVQGLQIVLVALASVPAALFERQLDFRSLFWVRFAMFGVPGLVSIPLAWFGFGYWALVGGALLGSLARLLTSFWNSHWRPRLNYDLVVARRLSGFGLWLSAEGLLAWTWAWIDTIVVGLYLSSHALGLYRSGNLFLGSVVVLLAAPVRPILYSSLVRLQDDPANFERRLLQANKLLLLIMLPFAVGTFLLSGPIEAFVFSANWPGIGSVIGILALLQGPAWLVGANFEAFRAIGRSDVNVKLHACLILGSVPLYAVAASHGLAAFLWTRLAVEVLAQPLLLFTARRVLGLSPVRIISQARWIALAVTVMAAWLVASGWWLTDTLAAGLEFGILASTGAAVYVLIVCLGERQFVRTLLATALGR